MQMEQALYTLHMEYANERLGHGGDCSAREALAGGFPPPQPGCSLGASLLQSPLGCNENTVQAEGISGVPHQPRLPHTPGLSLLL